jgi:ubiquinone/menaquinone biosynthesis C-methylase UbiE
LKTQQINPSLGAAWRDLFTTPVLSQVAGASHVAFANNELFAGSPGIGLFWRIIRVSSDKLDCRKSLKHNALMHDRCKSKSGFIHHGVGLAGEKCSHAWSSHCGATNPRLIPAVIRLRRRSPRVLEILRMLTDALTAVQSGYDRWAAVYDHDGNPLLGLETPAVQAAVGDVRGLNILDLGCGTGRHSLWLAAAGATVTAVDFSEGMLAEARRKLGAEEIEFIRHDLHQPLSFTDGQFDLVVSGLVLEHLRELDGFFAEAHRVLQSGGRAVVSAMHPAMFLQGSQARFTDPATGEVVMPGSLPHSVGAFVMAAVRAGFRLTNIEELAPDTEFAVQYPRAAKYIGWPMLVVLSLTA